MAGLRVHNMNQLNHEKVRHYFDALYKNNMPTSNIRIDALNSFLKKGFPSKKNEAWHYTDLTRFNDFSYQSPSAVTELDEFSSSFLKILNQWNTSSVVDLILALGVKIKHIKVAANKTEVIHLDENSEHTDLFLPIYHICLAEGASATIIDHDTGPSRHKHSLVVIEQSSHSQVKHFYANTDSTEVMSRSIFAELHNDCRYGLFALSGGEGLKRLECHVGLNASNSHAELKNIILGQNKSHLDIQFDVEHRQPNCTSQQISRAIMTDKSKGVFNSRVKVSEGADKTDAFQNSRNLLLSPTAEINTKPELEIYADDVKCAHGATVGELDADALFYMKSRGIPDEQAKTLLTYAFVEELLNDIDGESIKANFKETIEVRLNNMVK